MSNDSVTKISVGGVVYDAPKVQPSDEEIYGACVNEIGPYAEITGEMEPYGSAFYMAQIEESSSKHDGKYLGDLYLRLRRDYPEATIAVAVEPNLKLALVFVVDTVDSIPNATSSGTGPEPRLKVLYEGDIDRWGGGLAVMDPVTKTYRRASPMPTSPRPVVKAVQSSSYQLMAFGVVAVGVLAWMLIGRR